MSRSVLRENGKGYRIYSVAMSEWLYNKLEELSKQYGIPKSQIVRDAIIEKIIRMETGKINVELRGKIAELRGS